MTNKLIQLRVKAELKEQAEEIFEAMGITTSDAIRMFLQQTVNIGGLPFQPTAKIATKKPIKDKSKPYENSDI